MRDWDWENPQSLNLYQYVRNNPVTGFDPFGFYEFESTGNKKLDKKYQAKFEAARRANLKRGGDIAKTSEAYGDMGAANGIIVRFAVPETEGAEAEQGSSYSLKVIQRDDGTDEWSAPSTSIVTFNPSIFSKKSSHIEAVVGHEGSHQEDDNAFLASFDQETLEHDESLNPTIRDTEKKAYLITHDILSKAGITEYFETDGEPVSLGKNVKANEVQENIRKILQSPQYKNRLNEKKIEVK